MRYPSHKWVRSLEDYKVDRAEVEAWQHVELTVTNRSRAYPDRLGMDVGDTKEDFSVQF